MTFETVTKNIFYYSFIYVLYISLQVYQQNHQVSNTFKQEIKLYWDQTLSFHTFQCDWVTAL